MVVEILVLCDGKLVTTYVHDGWAASADHMRQLLRIYQHYENEGGGMVVESGGGFRAEIGNEIWEYKHGLMVYEVAW